MKKSLLLLLVLLVTSLKSQHSISGTFAPAEDYTWLIAYHLKPDAKNYIADSPIKDGKFKITIPVNSPTGSYRLVYAVPQDEFYFDVLYTGNEDIQLNFTTEGGVTFTNSEENILFNSYFFELQNVESQLTTYFTKGKKKRGQLQKILKKYRAVQASYEKKTQNLFVQQFIASNKPYIPARNESKQEYAAHRKKHYFDNLEVNNPFLQASGFLSDKLINYIFTALPMKQLSKEEKERAMQNNLRTVVDKLEGVSEGYQFTMLHSAWKQAEAANLHNLSSHINNEYLTNKAPTTENQRILSEIELKNRLRIGATAPEIIWKDGENLQSLSGLGQAENYVLVFWSSGCPHCLRELPALHKSLKEYSNIKVIAVGLEDNDVKWKVESAKLYSFEHAIALGKWDSEYANEYGIKATPTYFILDKDKRIISKPKNNKAVVAFLAGN